MATSKKLKSTKKRVSVKDLPAAKKKVSAKQMKKVKGGAGYIQFSGVDGEVTSKKRGSQ